MGVSVSRGGTPPLGTTRASSTCRTAPRLSEPAGGSATVTLPPTTAPLSSSEEVLPVVSRGSPPTRTMPTAAAVALPPPTGPPRPTSVDDGSDSDSVFSLQSVDSTVGGARVSGGLSAALPPVGAVGAADSAEGLAPTPRRLRGPPLLGPRPRVEPQPPSPHVVTPPLLSLVATRPTPAEAMNDALLSASFDTRAAADPTARSRLAEKVRAQVSGALSGRSSGPSPQTTPESAPLLLRDPAADLPPTILSADVGDAVSRHLEYLRGLQRHVVPRYFRGVPRRSSAGGGPVDGAGRGGSPPLLLSQETSVDSSSTSTTAATTVSSGGGSSGAGSFAVRQRVVRFSPFEERHVEGVLLSPRAMSAPAAPSAADSEVGPAGKPRLHVGSTVAWTDGSARVVEAGQPPPADSRAKRESMPSPASLERDTAPPVPPTRTAAVVTAPLERRCASFTVAPYQPAPPALLPRPPTLGARRFSILTRAQPSNNRPDGSTAEPTAAPAGGRVSAVLTAPTRALCVVQVPRTVDVALPGTPAAAVAAADGMGSNNSTSWPSVTAGSPASSANPLSTSTGPTTPALGKSYTFTPLQPSEQGEEGNLTSSEMSFSLGASEHGSPSRLRMPQPSFIVPGGGGPRSSLLSIPNTPAAPQIIHKAITPGDIPHRDQLAKRASEDYTLFTQLRNGTGQPLIGTDAEEAAE